MAGYSGTPLAKKLGIKAGCRMFVSGAPANYDDLLAPLPGAVTRARKVDAKTQLLHLFVTRRAQLLQALTEATPKLHPDAAIWISWGSSRMAAPTRSTANCDRPSSASTSSTSSRVPAST